MKRFSLLILLIAFAIQSNAQWTKIRGNIAEMYRTIHFSSADTGYLSGNCEGNIYKTTNGGLTWDTTTTPFIQDAYTAIHFPEAQSGFAVGTNLTFVQKNIVVKTDNGGLSWDTLYVDSLSNDFRDIDFADADNGLLMGYRVYLTNNGGQSFSLLNPTPDSFSYFYDAKMTSAGHVVASSSAATVSFPNGPEDIVFKIYTSDDNGGNWVQRYEDSNAVNGFFFLNETKGWAICGRKLLHTDDGGQSWSTSEMNFITDEFTLPEIVFTDPLNGWLIAGKIRPSLGIWDGQVYKTTDGGYNWSLNFTVDSQRIESFSMPAPGIGYLVTGSSVYKMTAGGTGIGLWTQAEEQVTAYPNPAQERLLLKIPSNTTITNLKLSDIYGRTIRTFKPGATDLDISGLPSSLYLLEIGTAKGKVSKKITITH